MGWVDVLVRAVESAKEVLSRVEVAQWHYIVAKVLAREVKVQVVAIQAALDIKRTCERVKEAIRISKALSADLEAASDEDSGASDHSVC